MPRIKMSNARPQLLKSLAVIAIPPDEPIVRGRGETDYICAGCERVIAESILLGEIDGLVFECSSCGTSNQALPLP